MKKNFLRQIVFPVLAALIWGTAFVAQSVCSDKVPPFAFNALRSFIAVILLSLVARLFDENSRKRGRAVSKVNWKKLACGGTVCGICLAIAANLQQAGIADTAAGKAGFLTALYVVLVPILALLLKKRASFQVWIGVFIAAAGLYFLCIKQGERFTLRTSDILLLLCALFFACQVLAVDYYVRFVDGVKLSCAQFLIAGVISAVLSFCFETVDWSAVVRCVWPILYVGVFSSGVAYTLQILAQEGSDPTVVTVLLSLESVFSVLAGAILLHDRLTGREYLGCVLMFIAVILAQIPIRRKKSVAV